MDIPEQMEEIRKRKNRSNKNPTPDPTPNPIDKTINPEKPKTLQEIFNARHPMEQKRRHTNREIRKICRRHNVFFLETWRGLEKKNKEVNLDYYANDGLHLSDAGVVAMGDYIQGSAHCLLDSRKSFRPKRNRGVKKNTRLSPK
jgi:hypothetical protein